MQEQLLAAALAQLACAGHLWQCLWTQSTLNERSTQASPLRLSTTRADGPGCASTCSAASPPRSLPLSHVTLRLEAIAAGLWPSPSDAARDSSLVVRCLHALLAPAAGDNASSVIAGVYEQLLAKRGALLDGGVAGAGVVLGGSGDGAARSALRLGLLKSLAAHCRIVMEEELSSSLTGQVREKWQDTL
jgi:hypothetical protein